MNIENFFNELTDSKLRTLSCAECKHRTSISRSQKKIFCDVINEYVKNNTSERCRYYQSYRDKSGELYRGHMIRQYQQKEYLTEKQWNKKGYILKNDAEGILMYASEVSAKKYPESLIRYYTEEEVEKIK